MTDHASVSTDRIAGISNERLAELIAVQDEALTGMGDMMTAEGHAYVFDAHSALTELQRLRSEERVWRQMLAFAYSSTNLYGDDGELQDSRLPYPIDYVRDTPEQIQQAIHNRGSLKLQQAIEKHGSYEAMLAAAQQPHEPDGDYKPNDTGALHLLGHVVREMQIGGLSEETLTAIELLLQRQPAPNGCDSCALGTPRNADGKHYWAVNQGAVVRFVQCSALTKGPQHPQDTSWADAIDGTKEGGL